MLYKHLYKDLYSEHEINRHIYAIYNKYKIIYGIDSQHKSVEKDFVG